MRCRFLLVVVVFVASVARADEPWVRVGPDGKLVYRADEQGNRIPDFSHCGYGGGGGALPVADVVLTLEPRAGDMTAALQQAIDTVARRPIDARGLRGAILLKRGTYRIGGTVNLHASGVVLRGEGQGEDGTVLFAAGKEKRTLIKLGGDGSRKWDETKAARVTDDYVPVGATSFRVGDPERLKVGMDVLVIRPSTEAWLGDIGMDRIPPHRDGRKITQWSPGSFDLRFDRIVTAIDGDRVTLDAPIGCALEARYGGGLVVPYRFDGRIEHAGIENLRSVSAYEKGRETEDEDHAWTFVEIDKAQHVWVRDVTTLHYGFGLADVQRDAKWVTVRDSSCLDPVSKITGSRRYSFNLGGQLALVTRCFSREARHDYAVAARVPGPNAFVDCVAERSHSDIGPHHRWSTATLFDSIVAPDCEVNLQNRMSLGSGHGWSGANSVLWNCVVREYAVQNPPAARNWAVGVVGRQTPGAFAGDRYNLLLASDFVKTHPTPDPAWRLNDRGTVQSPGKHVEPTSLYAAQLRERLGER